MPQCFVTGCGNYYAKTRGNVGIMYHMFPNNKKVAKVWALLCTGDEELEIPRHARVCSTHFQADAYQRDLQHELLGLPLRRKLKPNALPTLDLPTFNEDSTNVISRLIKEGFEDEPLPPTSQKIVKLDIDNNSSFEIVNFEQEIKIETNENNFMNKIQQKNTKTNRLSTKKEMGEDVDEEFKENKQRIVTIKSDKNIEEVMIVTDSSEFYVQEKHEQQQKQEINMHKKNSPKLKTNLIRESESENEVLQVESVNKRTDNEEKQKNKQRNSGKRQSLEVIKIKIQDQEDGSGKKAEEQAKTMEDLKKRILEMQQKNAAKRKSDQNADKQETNNKTKNRRSLTKQNQNQKRKSANGTAEEITQTQQQGEDKAQINKANKSTENEIIIIDEDEVEENKEENKQSNRKSLNLNLNLNQQNLSLVDEKPTNKKRNSAKLSKKQEREFVSKQKNGESKMAANIQQKQTKQQQCIDVSTEINEELKSNDLRVKKELLTQNFIETSVEIKCKIKTKTQNRNKSRSQSINLEETDTSEIVDLSNDLLCTEDLNLLDEDDVIANENEVEEEEGDLTGRNNSEKFKIKLPFINKNKKSSFNSNISESENGKVMKNNNNNNNNSNKGKRSRGNSMSCDDSLMNNNKKKVKRNNVVKEQEEEEIVSVSLQDLLILHKCLNGDFSLDHRKVVELPLFELKSLKKLLRDKPNVLTNKGVRSKLGELAKTYEKYAQAYSCCPSSLFKLNGEHNKSSDVDVNCKLRSENGGLNLQIKFGSSSFNDISWRNEEMPNATSTPSDSRENKNDKIKTDGNFTPQRPVLEGEAEAKNLVKSLENDFKVPMRSSLRIAKKRYQEPVSNSPIKIGKRSKKDLQREVLGKKLRFMNALNLTFKKNERTCISQNHLTTSQQSLNKMHVMEDVHEGGVTQPSSPGHADQRPELEIEPHENGVVVGGEEEAADSGSDKPQNEENSDKSDVKSNGKISPTNTNNSSPQPVSLTLKQEASVVEDSTSNDSMNLPPVNVTTNKRKNSNAEGSSKKFKSDLNECFALRDKILNDYINNANCSTVEQLQIQSDQIVAEIRTLNELAKEKEREWNNILHLKKIKEELLLRVQRQKQVLLINSEGFEGDLEIVSAETDKTHVSSTNKQSVLKQKYGNGGKQRNILPKNYSQQNYDVNGQDYKNKQRNVVDVQSLIADYRQKHPEAVPRRGRRIRSVLNSSSSSSENKVSSTGVLNISNLPLGTGGQVRQNLNVNSDSDSLNILLNSIECGKEFRGGFDISNANQQDMTSFKDMLVQFAKLSQTEKQELMQGKGKAPPPYPEVTVHPVSSAPSQHSSSLLHGILTKAQNKTDSKSTFSPTLARLLTAPERAAAASLNQSSSSSPNSATGGNVSISEILSGSKARNEITITPVGSQQECSTVNKVKTQPGEEEEAEDSADRLVIDESELLESRSRSNNDTSQDNNSDTEDVPQCQGCNQKAAQFVCAGCGNQWYCSRDCQVAAWDEHSEVCSG